MCLEEHRRGAIEVGMEGGKECNENDVRNDFVKEVAESLRREIVFGDAMSGEMARLEDASGG